MYKDISLNVHLFQREIVIEPNIHSVAISEFLKWQTLFHLPKNEYFLNLYNLKTRNANYLKF